jgi:N-glycosylase/DNA lyase
MLIKCTDGTLGYDAVLDLKKTLFCGQTFRWDTDGHGMYKGTAGFGDGERELCLSQEGDDITVSVPSGEFETFWSGYFDLKTDYGLLEDFAREDPFFAKCLEYGRGIRILRQDLWETIVTFILSQRSNMPRIRSCVGKLVDMFGHFPSPDELLAAGSIRNIRCGYREPYLKAAADFGGYERLYEMSHPEARKHLKQIRGIGDKVSDCVILFGLHDRRAFPVDVWIGRVIKKEYSGKLDTGKYGDMAGIVQQYIFYYAINHRREFEIT